METGLLIREATVADGAACAAVYAPYVRETAVTFELVTPSAREMGHRIESMLRTHEWLVLEDEGKIVGYAYAAPWAPRAAYRWACEVSIYLEQGRVRTGAGRALYSELLPRLAARGFRMAMAGMTMPNEASEALHREFGFVPVGTFKRVGWKLGEWHDVAWTQCTLSEGEDPPEDPR